MANKQPSAAARLAMTDDESWTLRLYGVVGDEWDGFTDDSVADLLAGLKPGGVVHLNTPGGTIYQGMAVYNQLKDKKPKSIRVDGLAASMGSVIALAGERTEMTKGSLMMIHNPWNIAMGDAEELRKTASILDKFKESLLDIYEAKTGQSRDLLAEMMDEETWLTADEAVEWGFADVVLEDEADIAAVNLSPLSDTQNMPERVQSAMAAQSNESQRIDIRAETVVKTPSAAEAAFFNTQEVIPMSKEAVKPSAAENPAVDKEALNKARDEAVAAERNRVQSIRTMVAEAKLDADFGQKLIDDGVSEAEAKASVQRLADYLAKSDPKAIKPVSGIEITRDERDTTRAAVTKALLNRAKPGAHKIEGDDPAREFINYTLMDMARHFVDASGRNPRGMSRVNLAQAAMHSTSDFPLILENVVGKSLRDGYEMAPRVFPLVGVRETLPDFKEVSRVRLGAAPALQQVQEGGEYTYGELTEAGEKYRVFKYGKVLSLTWEALINDDLNAFTRVPQRLGQAAAQLESEMFWAELTGNANLADGTALFAAGRGNLAGSGTAISIASLGAGRNAMRQMKDGDHFLGLQPQFLVVPTAIETDAEQFVSTNMQADASGNINPFAGRLQVISEPRLDANSTTAWYLFASPNAVDTIAFAYLQGEEGPQISTDEGFDVDGMKVKVRHCFGAKAIDFRGMYKNPGA